MHHEEELRSRLQALAAAGRVAPDAAAFGGVRRRIRRRLEGAMVLVLAGLLVAVGGLRLASEVGDRRGVSPVVPVAPSAGPPVAVAPRTFVGQVGDGASRRTVVIDARTGKVVRQVPGSDRRSELAADAVVAPDLHSMYLPTDGPGAGSACDAGWTRVDLATGARQPAFGGLAGVAELSLSADGRTLAYLHITAPATLDWGSNRRRCHTELVVRELGSGRQRTWTIPPDASVQGLQLSPDGTRLVFLLERTPGADRRLHLLPLAGTGSVTDGQDLPAAGDCGATMWRFLDDRRLLALAAQGCDTGRYDNVLVRFDLDTGQAVSTLPLGLPVEPFSLDVDRSGRHVLIAAAGKPNDQRPATVYVVDDGRPRRVPFQGDCWQADW
jgi:dipeptidyl aminopeptidase/acylaminoacyl peptidase